MKFVVLGVQGNIKDKDTCSVRLNFSEQVKDSKDDLSLNIDFDKDGNIISFPALELMQFGNKNDDMIVEKFMEDILKFEKMCAKKVCTEALEKEEKSLSEVNSIIKDVQ